MAECRDTRSQLKNKKIAFRRIIKSNKFKVWMNRQTLEALNKVSLDDVVDKLMDESNIVTEVKVNGKWTKVRMTKNVY